MYITTCSSYNRYGEEDDITWIEDKDMEILAFKKYWK